MTHVHARHSCRGVYPKQCKHRLVSLREGKHDNHSHSPPLPSSLCLHQENHVNTGDMPPPNEHERLLLDSPLDFPGFFNAWVNRPPRRRSVACVRTHTLAILACVARLAQVQGPRFPLSQRAYVTPTQPERLRPYTAAKTRFLRHATTITPARTLGLRCRIMVCHNRNWALNPPPTLLRLTELAPCHKFVSQARVLLNALHGARSVKHALG